MTQRILTHQNLLRLFAEACCRLVLAEGSKSQIRRLLAVGVPLILMDRCPRAILNLHFI